MPLLTISDDEWEEAKNYFDKNPKSLKLKKKKESKNDPKGHSFIKVGDEIYAVANRHAVGILGEGGFGKVKVVQKNNGENFAVKIEERGKKGEKSTEAKIMKLLNFSKGEAEKRISIKKFLFRVIKGELSNKKSYTVMELKEGRDLAKEIYVNEETEERRKLSTEKKLLFALKAAQAVQTLHNKGIVHADIKPANFMANLNGGNIAISAIDFGLSQILREDQTRVKAGPQGSRLYMAPELFNFSELSLNPKVSYSFASDVYALGKMFDEDLMFNDVVHGGMLESNPKKRIDLHSVIFRLISQLENRKSNLSEEEKNILAAVSSDFNEKSQKTLDFTNQLTRDTAVTWSLVEEIPLSLTTGQMGLEEAKNYIQMLKKRYNLNATLEQDMKGYYVKLPYAQAYDRCFRRKLHDPSEVHSLATDQPLNKEALIKIFLQQSKEQLNQEYENYRVVTNQSKIGNWMKNTKKYAGDKFFGKKTRETQMQHYTDVIMALKKTDKTQDEKAEIIYSTLCAIQNEIKDNSKTSGMMQFCQFKKEALARQFPELRNMNPTQQTSIHQDFTEQYLEKKKTGPTSNH